MASWKSFEPYLRGRAVFLAGYHLRGADALLRSIGSACSFIRGSQKDARLYHLTTRFVKDVVQNKQFRRAIGAGGGQPTIEALAFTKNYGFLWLWHAAFQEFMHTDESSNDAVAVLVESVSMLARKVEAAYNTKFRLQKEIIAAMSKVNAELRRGANDPTYAAYGSVVMRLKIMQTTYTLSFGPVVKGNRRYISYIWSR